MPDLTPEHRVPLYCSQCGKHKNAPRLPTRPTSIEEVYTQGGVGVLVNYDGAFVFVTPETMREARARAKGPFGPERVTNV